DVLETEGLLADIQEAQKEALRAREAAARERAEAENLRRELARRLAEIEQARREVLQRAREEAARQVEEVRKELARLRRLVQRAPLPQPEELQAAEDRVEELARELAPIRTRPAVRAPFQPRPGERVWVAGLRMAGEVAHVDDQEAEVQVGSFRVRVPVEELEAHAKAVPGGRVPAPAVEVRGPRASDVPTELNCRGLTVEEALEQVGKYLDRAFLAGLPQVRIIHGKGTGTLRRAVREELARHPLVTSFRPGARHEGGDGATVVELVQPD
ncbi:MAG: Smr/MutS family protein, partial [Anaerolineae bacterium]|nr:Smr/MutS family protein [Anaerolineae bacterium]